MFFLENQYEKYFCRLKLLYFLLQFNIFLSITSISYFQYVVAYC